MRSTFMLIVLGAAACVPSSRTDDVVDPDDTLPTPTPGFDVPVGTDGGGRFFEDPVGVTWAVREERPGGNCTQIQVSTNTVPIDPWAVTLTLDQPVTAVSSESGLAFGFDGPNVVITSLDSSGLQPGSPAVGDYCITPDARPISMSASATPEVVDTADPGDPGVLYGTLAGGDRVVGLRWEEDGIENGGACISIDVVSLAEATITDWSVSVQMTGVPHLTALSGLNFFAGLGDELLIFPDANSSIIDPFDDQRGRVCLAPLVVPVSMTASYSFDAL